MLGFEWQEQLVLLQDGFGVEIFRLTGMFYFSDLAASRGKVLAHTAVSTGDLASNPVPVSEVGALVDHSSQLLLFRLDQFRMRDWQLLSQRLRWVSLIDLTRVFSFELMSALSHYVVTSVTWNEQALGVLGYELTVAIGFVTLWGTSTFLEWARRPRMHTQVFDGGDVGRNIGRDVAHRADFILNWNFTDGLASLFGAESWLLLIRGLELAEVGIVQLFFWKLALRILWLHNLFRTVAAMQFGGHLRLRLAVFLRSILLLYIYLLWFDRFNVIFNGFISRHKQLLICLLACVWLWGYCLLSAADNLDETGVSRLLTFQTSGEVIWLAYLLDFLLLCVLAGSTLWA